MMSYKKICLYFMSAAMLFTLCACGGPSLQKLDEDGNVVDANGTQNITDNSGAAGSVSSSFQGIDAASEQEIEVPDIPYSEHFKGGADTEYSYDYWYGYDGSVFLKIRGYGNYECSALADGTAIDTGVDDSLISIDGPYSADDMYLKEALELSDSIKKAIDDPPKGNGLIEGEETAGESASVSEERVLPVGRPPVANDPAGKEYTEEELDKIYQQLLSENGLTEDDEEYLMNNMPAYLSDGTPNPFLPVKEEDDDSEHPQATATTSNTSTAGNDNEFSVPEALEEYVSLRDDYYILFPTGKGKFEVSFSSVFSEKKLVLSGTVYKYGACLIESAEIDEI